MEEERGRDKWKEREGEWKEREGGTSGRGEREGHMEGEREGGRENSVSSNLT